MSGQRPKVCIAISPSYISQEAFMMQRRVSLLFFLIVFGSVILMAQNAKLQTAPSTVHNIALPGHPSPVGDKAASISGILSSNGKYDFVALLNPGNISVRLGNGTGSFTSGTSLTPGTTGNTLSDRSIVIADFNGDNKPDIASCDEGSNTVSIFLGNGDGTFGSRNTVTVGSNPTSMAVLDFNRDGKLDLAVTNYNSNTVSLLAGNGSGGFSAAQTVPVAAYPSCIGVADLNGDDRADLVVTSFSNSVSVILGGATGTFGSATTYSTSSPRGTVSFCSVALGYFSGHDTLDIAAASMDSTVYVFRGNGNGTFSSSTINWFSGIYKPVSIVASDFNNDGNTDFAVANNTQGTVTIRLGDGTGSFASPITVTVPASSTNGITVADINGDGLPDFIVNSYGDGSAYIVKNNGSGSFSYLSTTTVGASSLAIAVGDLNGDRSNIPSGLLGIDDNNTPYPYDGFGYSGGTPGFGWFNQLTPASYPSTLTSVRARFSTYVSSGSQVKLVVYNDPENNGPNNSQAPTVNQTVSVTRDVDGWSTFTLSSPVTINSGSFAIGFIDNVGSGLQYPATPNMPGLSSPPGSRSFETDDGGSTFMSEFARGNPRYYFSFLIRGVASTPTLGEYIPDANTTLLLHMDESSGSAVLDASGSGTNGTATGTTIVGGRFGKSRSFNGTSDYVTFSAGAIPASGDFTVECWAYGISASGFREILSQGSHPNFYLGYDNNHVIRASDGWLSTGVPFPFNAWHHFAVVKTSTNVLLYVDGGLAASHGSTMQNPTLSSSFALGIIYNAVGEFWDGMIDEVRVSNKARSPKEFDLQIPPTNLTATANGTTIDLSWRNGGGVVPLRKYRVYRGLDSTNVTLIDSTASTYYSSTGLAAGTRYYFRVSAVDSTSFEGARGFAASAIPTNSPATAPSAPTNLTATAVTSSRITLSWTASASGTPFIYRIYRSLTSGSGFGKIDSVAGTTTAYADTVVQANSTYYYLVYALNGGGVSPASNQATATTATAVTATITVTTPATNLATSYAYPIRWSSQNLTGTVNIKLSLDNGSTFPVTIASSVLNSGSYSWTVPASQTLSTSCVLKIESSASPLVYGISNKFSIVNGGSVTFAQPATVTATFSSLPTSGNDYRLISFPGDLSGVSVSALALQGTQDKDWKMFREPGNSSQGFVSLSSGSSLKTGEGYWYIQKGPLSKSVSFTTPALNADATVSLALTGGMYSIIGDPFNVPVPWSSVLQLNGLDASTPLWSWNGSWSSSNSYLQPGVGYYFNSTGVGALKIPYAPFGFPSQVSPPGLKIDWKLQLVFESQTNKDDENYIGIAEEATPGKDRFEFNKPPLIFDQSFLYMKRPTWDNKNDMFYEDYRPDVGNGQTWEFDITNPEKTLGTINIVGVDQIPSQYTASMVNEETGVTVNLRRTASMEYGYGRSTGHFKIIVGPEAYVSQQMAPYMPKDFMLEQNYPNPFNPSTVITFQLPKAVPVRLEVFSLLGQAIKVLAEGNLEPGTHQVVWKGDNAWGARVASGVYFCRLIAGRNTIQTRKMLLTK